MRKLADQVVEAESSPQKVTLVGSESSQKSPPKSQSTTTSSTTIKQGSAQVAVGSMPSATSTERTVADLRAKPGLVITPKATVAEAARLLSGVRQDACLVLSSNTLTDARLEGILTDTDVVRKVLAMGLDPETVCVADVMTTHPVCVSEGTPTSVALEIMITKRCRHLPVINATDGCIVALLDVAKLLFDAMADAQGRSSSHRTLAEVASPSSKPDSPDSHQRLCPLTLASMPALASVCGVSR